MTPDPVPKITFRDRILLATVVLIVLAAGTFTGGCAAISSFLTTPAGAALITGVGDVAVGILETKGYSADQIHTLATTLQQADYATGVPINGPAAAAILQAHGANVSTANQSAVTALATATGAALQQYAPKLASGLQVTSTDLLQAIATASSPNPQVVTPAPPAPPAAAPVKTSQAMPVIEPDVVVTGRAHHRHRWARAVAAAGG